MTIKKIVFEEEDEQHARMLVRLRYDKLTQGNFFRGLVELYIDNDLNILRAIEKIKQKKSSMGYRKRQKSMRDIEKGQTNVEALSLSKKEKTFIYDLIEIEEEEVKE